MGYQSLNTLQSKHFLKIFLLMLAVFPAPETTNALSEGDKIPSFTVYAGKDKRLHSSALAGRVIILTYESKDRVSVNNHFKKQVLKAFPDHATDNSPVTVLAVISCFEFLWPFDRYCIAEVQKNAKKLGLPLYDDRTGKMFRDLDLKKDASNILVIDCRGIVQYRRVGKLSPQETETAIKCIKALCR